MRKPPIVKKFEKVIGEIEDWEKISEENQKATIKYAKHMERRGQLDEVLRR